MRSLITKTLRCCALLALGGLAACGPVPVAQAERQCLDRALLAKHPRGEVSVGASSNGNVAGGLELEVSSDFLMGRDPSAVFDACVQRAAGVLPSRPLYTFPEWKG
jgi:hypothetical protein